MAQAQGEVRWYSPALRQGQRYGMVIVRRQPYGVVDVLLLFSRWGVASAYYSAPFYDASESLA